MQRNFIAHRQTPEPLMPSPRVKVDKGQLTVDSSAWETAVEALFKNGGTHVFVPVWGFYPEPAFAQGLYFLYHYPAVTNQRWLGAIICQQDKTLTPEFQQLFGTYLKHMHGVLKQRGWLDRAFIGTMDEPYTYHLGDRVNDIPANNYEVVRNFVAFVRATGSRPAHLLHGGPGGGVDRLHRSLVPAQSRSCRCGQRARGETRRDRDVLR